MGRAAPLLIGLDIETDTSDNGLDPGVAGVVAVALSTGDDDVVITGREAAILRSLEETLASFERGIVVTWNGGAFDLPFLASRARLHGVGLRLELHWDPALSRPGRTPIPGTIGTYVARWGEHAHLDAYRAWRAMTTDPDESCALKAVARREGLAPVEVDRDHLHETSLATLRRYVTSDASLARVLAESRWSVLRRHVDRLPTGGQLALGSC